MLAILLMQSGHSQTLPEQLTAENVMSFVEANSIDNVAELIESLPPLHQRHISLVFESQALNREFVSRTHPRVVSWGADARFVLSWATNPDAPDSVEFLQPKGDRWDAGVIDFSGEVPKLSRPEVCSTCHGHLQRPIWGEYPRWKGTNDDRDITNAEYRQILSDLEASNNPRISPLELIEQRVYPTAVSTATGNEAILPQFAGEFASMASLRHAEVLFNRLKKRDNFAELAEQAVCGDIKPVVNGLFPMEDHFLALMHRGDQLILVQDDSEDLPHPQEYFGSGNGSVEQSLEFLLLHDIWSRDGRVSDFYATLGNEQVSDFRLHYSLNYFPGTATAEQEMRATYDQHFRLKGQASLNARIDKEIRRTGPHPGESYVIRDTASFYQGHYGSMAPRVCNIVRQAPGQRLSQLRIADGRAGEDAGEIAFTVTLDPVLSEPVRVLWGSPAIEKNHSQFPDSAGADRGDDFVYGHGVLTFNAGEARKNLTVEIIDDDMAEPPEFFVVFLGFASANALIVDGLALATIEGELPPLEQRELTARFENAPATHDGMTAFSMLLRFSEEVTLNDAAFSDDLLMIAGGTVGEALRVTIGSNLVWEFSVTPDGEGDVVITLSGDQECDANLMACTRDGRWLQQAATVTIPWSAQPPASAEPPTLTGPPTSAAPPPADMTDEDGDTATPVDDPDDESAVVGTTGDGSSAGSAPPPPAVAAAWGERLSERDIQLPSGSDPTGLWSDGTTLWVISNWSAGEVTTYSLADGSALGAGEVTLSDGTSASHRFSLGANGFSAGLWSDGETLWVADNGSKVSAYRLADGARQSDEDVPQTALAAAGNITPTGLWSDGETLWVADNQAWKVFAYRLSDKVRVPEKEFDLLTADRRRLSPWGLWSDGETVLATLYSDGGVQGYALSGGAHKADQAIDAAATGPNPKGLWSDRATLWVVSEGDSLIRAYAVPGLRPATTQNASSVADPFRVGVVTRVDAAPGGVDVGPPVYIADAALHGAIAGALGLGPEDPVGVNAIERIRALNVRRADIADLTGLEYAVNLQALDLGHNPIRDPWMLGLLPRLTVLNLDGAVSELSSLAGVVALERLSLRNNGLTDVSALAGLVNLRHLSLRGNAVSDAWPLAGLVQLEMLDLRGNPLRSQAPLSGLYNLRNLDLSDNARVKPPKDAVTQ